jgi:hypothetical protein
LVWSERVRPDYETRPIRSLVVATASGGTGLVSARIIIRGIDSTNLVEGGSRVEEVHE